MNIAGGRLRLINGMFVCLTKVATEKKLLLPSQSVSKQSKVNRAFT